MSQPQDLRDLYLDELKDTWSANDQMQRVLKKLVPKAGDDKLKAMLTKSVAGIAKHTSIVKELISASGEKTSKDHCKAMEGLVREAVKHVIEEGPPKGPTRDAVIITQYQRMTHYGIAGFGTAASFAGTLGLKDAQKKLKQATREIYMGDEYMTRLAETTVNIKAKDE